MSAFRLLRAAIGELAADARPSSSVIFRPLWKNSPIAVGLSVQLALEPVAQRILVVIQVVGEGFSSGVPAPLASCKYILSAAGVSSIRRLRQRRERVLSCEPRAIRPSFSAPLCQSIRIPHHPHCVNIHLGCRRAHLDGAGAAS
jgi:hypothetical protein